jgi:CBS domain-containing protein
MMTTTVKQVLQGKSSQIHTLSPDNTVYEALEAMANLKISAVLITEGGHLVGIFTERDYARKVALQGRKSSETRVGDLMTRNLLTISPRQMLDDVMQMMTENRIRHLPVVEQGKLIGIVTIGDAVKAVMDEQQHTIDQLSSYIAGDITTV